MPISRPLPSWMGDVRLPPEYSRVPQQPRHPVLSGGPGTGTGGGDQVDQAADTVPPGERADPTGQVVQRDPALLQGAVEQFPGAPLGEDAQAVEDGPGPTGDEQSADELDVVAGEPVPQDAQLTDTEPRRWR
jgi:hypothetical protein